MKQKDKHQWVLGKCGTIHRGNEQRIYNHQCKYCVHLKANFDYKTVKSPYICEVKKTHRHYTSKVICNRFVQKCTATDNLIATYIGTVAVEGRNNEQHKN